MANRFQGFDPKFFDTQDVPTVPGPPKQPRKVQKTAAADYVDLDKSAMDPHDTRKDPKVIPLHNPGLTKGQQAKVGRKISRVARDEPGLTQQQRVGKAIGVVRHRERKAGRSFPSAPRT